MSREGTRPVFAIGNPLIADGLSQQIPIWAPGGALALLDSLIEPYELTGVDASQARVEGAERAEYAPELTKVL